MLFNNASRCSYCSLVALLSGLNFSNTFIVSSVWLDLFLWEVSLMSLTSSKYCKITFFSRCFLISLQFTRKQIQNFKKWDQNLMKILLSIVIVLMLSKNQLFMEALTLVVDNFSIRSKQPYNDIVYGRLWRTLDMCNHSIIYP